MKINIGYICSYTPVELILSAGLNPVRLIPKTEAMETGNAALYSNLCPYIRAILTEATNRGFPELHGMVFVNSCDAMRRLIDAWSLLFSRIPHFVLSVPRRTDERAILYFAEEIKKLKEWLEATFTPEISTQSIHDSISRVNSIRRKISQIYNERKGQKNIIDTGIFFEKMVDAQRTGFEEIENFLNEYLSQDKKQRKDKGIPLIFAGSSLKGRELFDIIEESGGIILVDDFCETHRNFTGEVALNNDFTNSIATRYLKEVYCARVRDRNPFEHFAELQKIYSAKGIIYHTLKFCDQYRYNAGYLKNSAVKAGLHFLNIETEYSSQNLGQLQTRIQAFLELMEVQK